MSLNCIIVDDEILAQDVLERYCERMPNLKVIAKCHTAIEAISVLNEHSIDLIFLDINMPEISGLEMLKMLENRPKVIFTTAYSEFAIDSYDVGAVDYLLKPIQFDRFVKAVNRVYSQTKIVENKTIENLESNIVLKQDGALVKVQLNAILYIEAYGNYINIYTRKKKFTIREKMHEIENKLPSHLFVRSHKSYIVSLNEISKIEGNRIFIDDKEIPIGKVYRIDVLRKFKDISR